METFSALLALCAGNSPVTGEFPSQRPVMWSFDVFFDLCLNKLLSKQSRRWWFETSLRSLWRYCNGGSTSGPLSHGRQRSSYHPYPMTCLLMVWRYKGYHHSHRYYSDIIMSAMASHITSVSIVCSAICSGADQRKHQCSTSLDFARWPVHFRHKGPVTQKMVLFEDDMVLN